MGTVGRHRKAEYPLGLYAVIHDLFPDLPPSRIYDLDVFSERVEEVLKRLEPIAVLEDDSERHQFRGSPNGERVSLWFGDFRIEAARAELNRIRCLRILARFEAFGRPEKAAVGQVGRDLGLEPGQVRGAIARARKLRAEPPRVAAHTRRRHNSA